MRRLQLVPDAWPDGCSCRQPGCARPAVPPHGYCLAHELEHLQALAARSEHLALLAHAAYLRAPWAYDALDSIPRQAALAHIAAHAAETGDRLNVETITMGLIDCIRETSERETR